MKIRQLPLILLILAVSLGRAAGQADSIPDGGEWTLRECVDYALAQSLTVKRSELDVEGSQIDHNLARWQMVPTLNASVSHGLNWGRSINPVTNLFTTQEIQSNQLAAQSGVTLFNGLRVQNEIKQTRHSLQATEADLEKSRNDVIINVVTLYVNVVFNKELLENARLQLASSQAQLNRTRVQVELGALPLSDQLNLEAEVASNDLNVVNQENALGISLLELKQAMQVPASVELDVVVPELTVEDLVLEQTRDEVFRSAMLVMPEIRSADLWVESAEYGIKAAKGNLYPRLSLFGSITTNYSSASDGPHFIPSGDDPVPTIVDIGYVEGTGQRVLANEFQTPGEVVESYGRRDQFKDNIFRAVSLSLSIPIFNGMQSRSAYQRSVIQRNQAELNRQDVRNQLRQLVETAYNEAVAASKTYHSAQQQVAAREEAFRSIQARYSSGASNFFEYQLAESQLFQARSDLSRAKYNFVFRKKILDFYQNKPVDF
ncbi:MAG TPA: TolC family protein [Cyclobacteriaceae bacterium]|nr:TolC family protein [Cyclobacteriaceae bacterium]